MFGKKSHGPSTSGVETKEERHLPNIRDVHKEGPRRNEARLSESSGRRGAATCATNVEQESNDQGASPPVLTTVGTVNRQGTRLAVTVGALRRLGPNHLTMQMSGGAVFQADRWILGL